MINTDFLCGLVDYSVDFLAIFMITIDAGIFIVRGDIFAIVVADTDGGKFWFISLHIPCSQIVTTFPVLRFAMVSFVHTIFQFVSKPFKVV